MYEDHRRDLAWGLLAFFSQQRIAGDEPGKKCPKIQRPLSQEKGKEVIGMQKIKLASESHVPRFRAGVGTWRSGYMIPIRLPWRHRARPSATLHEIQVCLERQTCPSDLTMTSCGSSTGWSRILEARKIRRLQDEFFKTEIPRVRRSWSAISWASSLEVCFRRWARRVARER